VGVIRTNIVIDDALMRQAMQVTGARSKREAVELGLRTLVRLQQQAEIRSFRGRLHWEDDLESQRLDKDQECSQDDRRDHRHRLHQSQPAAAVQRPRLPALCGTPGAGGGLSG
jgi:Arc/MetJ family transcription regulator